MLLGIDKGGGGRNTRAVEPSRINDLYGSLRYIGLDAVLGDAALRVTDALFQADLSHDHACLRQPDFAYMGAGVRVLHVQSEVSGANKVAELTALPPQEKEYSCQDFKSQITISFVKDSSTARIVTWDKKFQHPYNDFVSFRNLTSNKEK